MAKKMGICCTTLNHLPPPNLWLFNPVAQEAHVRVFHKSKDYDHPHLCSVCVPPQKYFSHPSVRNTFSQPHPLNWNGDCKQVGTTNNKPPGPIIITDQSKTGTSNHIIFITLFSSRFTTLQLFVPASGNWANMQEKNHFPGPNRHLFRFLHPFNIYIYIYIYICIS